MDTRMFYILFIEFVIFLIVILGLLFVLNSESGECVCNENSGAMQSPEAAGGSLSRQYTAISSTNSEAAE